MAANAFVFMEAKGSRVHELIKQLEKIESIESVEIITGPYDLIVKIHSLSATDSLKLVVEKIHGMEGVIRTHTSIVYDIK